MSEQSNFPYQQSLGIKISDKIDFSTYEIGEKNQATVSLLTKATRNYENESFYVFGPAGCGKTHLLNALFHLNPEPAINCFFMDLKQAKNIGSFVLDANLPNLVILDNVDVIAGDEEFEEAVFALFNRWYDKRQGTLIMSGSKSFDSINFIKKDLTTRLSSGVICQLDYLNEAESLRAMLRRAHARYINLPENTASFLVKNFNRDMRSLVPLLDRLEDAQIEQTHELTIPFVKNVFGL